MNLSPRSIGQNSGTISPEMFGGNLLFRYDVISGAGATYGAVADYLGVSSLRYPGGTMTEINFDVNNPDSPPLGVKSGSSFVGVTPFLEYANSTNRGVNMVIPTRNIYSGTANANTDTLRDMNFGYIDDILDFVRLLLTYGDSADNSIADAAISTIEIGNEYWGGGKMTASEYGQVVNYLVPKLDEIFDEMIPVGGERPRILVQMGSPLDPQFKTGLYSGNTYSERLYQSNMNIINQISDPRAASGIDGLVQHYYYSTDSLELTKNTWTMNSIDECFAIWGRYGYGDREYHMTEWNVGLANVNQLGLRGASIFIEQFSYMVEVGVDAAFAWPVQGYTNGLFQNGDNDLHLSPIGAAFKLMAESLVGTRLLPYDIQGGSLEVEAFGSEARTVLFISSRSEQSQFAEIDLNEILGEVGSVEIVKLGIGDNIFTAEANAAAVLENISADAVFRLGTLSVYLKPFEVLRVIFHAPVGREIIGSHSSELLNGGRGKDTIFGYLGNDSLYGMDGNDLLNADAGNDIIISGSGDDTILGGYGNDTVAGGVGRDLIEGGLGDDLLMPLSGADTVRGGDGQDTVFGGSDGALLHGGKGSDLLNGFRGNDTLNGGAGQDTLIGGSGGDTFVFDILSAQFDTILDFEAGYDVIRLDHGVFVGLGIGSLTSSQFSLFGHSPRNGTPSLIYHSEKKLVYFDAFGDGLNAADKIVFRVGSDSHLSEADFIIS